MKSDKPRLNDFIDRTGLKDPKAKLYGARIGITISLTVILVAAGFVVLGLWVGANGHLFWGLVVLWISVTVIGVAWSTLKEQRRSEKIYSAVAEAAADPRDPILYLRPFGQDSLVNPRRDIKRHPEEFLTSVLTDIGPVVAVGTPGEKLPSLGSVKLYFRDDEWQENVRRLMSLSRLICIQVTADIPPGLEWEISAAKDQVEPEKVIFSFVAWHELKKRSRRLEYDLFRNEAERLYGIHFPEKFNDAYFAYFENNWEPRLAYANRLERVLLSRTTGLHIRETLRPVLAKRGITLGGRYYKWAFYLLPFFALGLIFSMIIF